MTIHRMRSSRRMDVVMYLQGMYSSHCMYIRRCHLELRLTSKLFFTFDCVWKCFCHVKLCCYILSVLPGQFIQFSFLCQSPQVYPRLFRNFHRQVFCWLDEWYGMTMEDIRRLEAEAKEELDRVCVGYNLSDQFSSMRLLYTAGFLFKHCPLPSPLLLLGAL